MSNTEKKMKTKTPRGPMGPGMSGGSEKANHFTQSLKDLLNYCKRYGVAIVIALVLASAGAVLSIIGPDKVAEITDIISRGMMTSIDLDAIMAVCTTLLIIYGLSFVFNYVQGFIMATVSQVMSKALRSDITSKINRLPLRYFDNSSTGDTLSRVTNDVDTIGQTLNQSLSSLLSSIVMFVGAAFMMFKTNWIMAASGIGASLIGFVFMMIIVSKSQTYFTQQQEALGAVNGEIEEIYSGHNVVKAYNGEKQAKDTFAGLNKGLYQSAWKSQFISGLMMPLMQFVGNFGYVVVCVVGVVLVFNGQITFGVIVAFMLYIRLFTQPLSQIAQSITGLQSTAAASERVFEFLNEEELADEPAQTPLTEVQGEVEFSHVKFGYTPEKTIIHDFSVHVQPGQKVAIVGPTGAGKTTLVNLLMKFYTVDQGDISIDGKSINELTREQIHDCFGMVLQDTWLFEGTIKENMIYNGRTINDAQLEQVGKAVGLHHFISTLPDGYNTVLNDNNSLSIGQKQLVTIARAMIKDAPMLILDEATSSVDTRTEILIQEAMDRLMAGRTSFIIAHRLSTIKNADVILVMKDGDIIEKGNHDSLLEKKGFYAELYNSQFSEDDSQEN